MIQVPVYESCLSRQGPLSFFDWEDSCYASHVDSFPDRIHHTSQSNVSFGLFLPFIYFFSCHFWHSLVNTVVTIKTSHACCWRQENTINSSLTEAEELAKEVEVEVEDEEKSFTKIALSIVVLEYRVWGFCFSAISRSFVNAIALRCTSLPEKRIEVKSVLVSSLLLTVDSCSFASTFLHFSLDKQKSETHLVVNFGVSGAVSEEETSRQDTWRGKRRDLFCLLVFLPVFSAVCLHWSSSSFLSHLPQSSLVIVACPWPEASSVKRLLNDLPSPWIPLRILANLPRRSPNFIRRRWSRQWLSSRLWPKSLLPPE